MKRLAYRRPIGRNETSVEFAEDSMEQGHRNWTVAAVVAIVIGHAQTVIGSPPQVPSLPLQTAGYVDYAITNLPAEYATGAVAATNNTPPSNPITDASATLGRVLFYDKRLSINKTVACARAISNPKAFRTPVNSAPGSTASKQHVMRGALQCNLLHKRQSILGRTGGFHRGSSPRSHSEPGGDGGDAHQRGREAQPDDFLPNAL